MQNKIIYNLYCICGTAYCSFCDVFPQLDKPFLSQLTAPRQIQDPDFRSGSCFTSKNMNMPVSELKAAQKSRENVLTACITSRYRFVSTSLICLGLHAVNTCPLLLQIVILILLTLDCWDISMLITICACLTGS